MANAHVSLPKPFMSSNIHKQFVHFNICAGNANKCDDKTARRGRAHSMAGTQHRNEDLHHDTLLWETFQQRIIVLGEALPVFLHDLKQLLEQAMPVLDSTAKGATLAALVSACSWAHTQNDET